LERQNKPDAMLRVFVAGGGCSGFQYGMTLEEEPMEGDERFEANGVRVIVDPRSAMYLDGANIDFVESMMGGGFKIDNQRRLFVRLRLQFHAERGRSGTSGKRRRMRLLLF
jgi:iron-sulfur cluster assembly protein